MSGPNYPEEIGADIDDDPFELAARQGIKITELPLTIDEMIDQLQGFDRSDLRRIAYEALLRSDGADKFRGGVASTFVVHTSFICRDADNPQFTMWRRED